ncbi:hypothetical protein ACFLXQ_00335 [Chloroflexota bacterium]
MSKIQQSLSNLFGQLLKNEPMPDQLTQRIDRVAQSILENESLTSELDDAAAQELLDWGVDWAKIIVLHTANLNEIEAEEVMSPQLRANRRLMRVVNKWITKQQAIDVEDSAKSLTKIIEQVAIIYGEDFIPPDGGQCVAFARLQIEFMDNPQQMITNLREWLKTSSRISLTNEGENHDKEN